MPRLKTSKMARLPYPEANTNETQQHFLKEQPLLSTPTGPIFSENTATCLIFTKCPVCARQWVDLGLQFICYPTRGSSAISRQNCPQGSLRHPCSLFPQSLPTYCTIIYLLQGMRLGEKLMRLMAQRLSGKKEYWIQTVQKGMGGDHKKEIIKSGKITKRDYRVKIKTEKKGGQVGTLGIWQERKNR